LGPTGIVQASYLVSKSDAVYRITLPSSDTSFIHSSIVAR
jgi:hypothetical protein